jgi:hypothetical protein
VGNVNNLLALRQSERCVGNAQLAQITTGIHLKILFELPGKVFHPDIQPRGYS